MSTNFIDGHPPLHYSATIAAVCRAIIAKDTDALDALLGDADVPELRQLVLAGAWLVIQCHRSVMGDDMAAIDGQIADLQAQFIAILVRHPEES